MSVSEKVAVMDQHADSAALDDEQAVQSGLAHVGLPAQGAKAPRGSTVSLLEQQPVGLLLLRASAEASALSKALQSTCGVSLSARLQSDNKDAYCVRWMSPDCWLLSCPLEEAFSIEQKLRKAVSGHIAIVNVSGGYCVLELAGADARQVLMKSTGYDVHPEHFIAGKVVNTTFAKAQATLRVIECSDKDGRYELIIRRSFSDYVWLWLQRAASEYAMHATVDQGRPTP